MIIWVVKLFFVQFLCVFLHLFLISSASVRSIPFLSFIEPIFAWYVPLVSLTECDSLEKRMANHFSILGWKIPWTEDPGGLQSMESQRVRHDWACTQYTIVCMYVCVYTHMYIHTQYIPFLYGYDTICTNCTTFTHKNCTKKIFMTQIIMMVWWLTYSQTSWNVKSSGS